MALPLQSAEGKTVPDVIASGLKVLFCGINPSLYSAYVGHHFARPGNRFWKALHGAGFTPRLFSPSEDELLIQYGCGITNIVDEATRKAAELTSEQLKKGKTALEKKVHSYHPQVVAVLGVGSYRVAFEKPEARIGEQEERIDGTRVWVLPNPSGLNAHYQERDLITLFGELCKTVRS